MIPNAQFDAASLAVWTTTGSLDEAEASIAAHAMQLASHSQDLSKFLVKFPHGHPQRARLLWLISSVWHEKRHFFDTCLTNYGARRFRDLFTLAGNLAPLLAEAHAKREPVWFPVELYGSPVLRRLLKISDPPNNILQIASLAKAIKDFSTQLDAPLANRDRLLYLGGEAQLEGLGQVSQVHSIEYTFGAEDVIEITNKYVRKMAPEGPYRSIETVARKLGCDHDNGKAIVLNPNLASALFITALCGRFFGAGPKPAADLLAPMSRLSRLIEELGPAPGRYDMSDEEAAELVDKAAKRLWGRTAFEEIAADIDTMEAKVDAAKNAWLNMWEGLYDAYKDFVKLRRRVLARAKTLGPASVLPRAFPILWRDRLKPWQVVATPGGDFEAEGAPIVFGTKLSVPRGLPESVAWARLHIAEDSDTDDVFAPRAREAWLQVLEHHAPGAFLMLNGRRHRRMVPFELEQRIAEIEGYEIPVRFHPLFEWPEQRDQRSRIGDTLALSEFSGRTSFTCDITGNEIKPNEAATLTPWEFRRSPLLPKFQEHGIIAEFKLLTDWSDWIVRRDLLEDPAV